MNAVNILARDLQIGDEILLDQKPHSVAVVAARHGGTYVVCRTVDDLAGMAEDGCAAGNFPVADGGAANHRRRVCR